MFTDVGAQYIFMQLAPPPMPCTALFRRQVQAVARCSTVTHERCKLPVREIAVAKALLYEITGSLDKVLGQSENIERVLDVVAPDVAQRDALLVSQ